MPSNKLLYQTAPPLVAAINPHTRCPHVLATVDNVANVDTLIDTGASISIIRLDAVKQLHNPQILPANHDAVAANNQPLPLISSIWITVTIGDTSQVIRAQIQQSLSSSLLLGTDFLFRFNNFTLNNKNQTVTFGNTTVPAVGIHWCPPTERGGIIIDEQITIPFRYDKNS